MKNGDQSLCIKGLKYFVNMFVKRTVVVWLEIEMRPIHQFMCLFVK